MKRVYLYLFFYFVAIIVATSTLVACFGNKPSNDDASSPADTNDDTTSSKRGGGNPFSQGPPEEIINVVKIRELTKGTLNEVLTIGADVAAINEAQIFPETSGTIASVRVVEGETVRKGQILGYVDPSRAGSNFNLSPIESSISGTVSAIISKVGSTVGPQAPIFVISDLRTLEITVQVPERYAGNINKDVRGSFYIFANPDEAYEVYVDNFSNVISTQSRTMKTTLRFLNPNDAIKAGMYGTVDLVIRTFDKVTILQEQEIVSELKDGVLSEGVFLIAEPDKEQTTVSFVAIDRLVNQNSLVGVENPQLEGAYIVNRGQNVLGGGAKIRISR